MLEGLRFALCEGEKSLGARELTRRAVGVARVRYLDYEVIKISQSSDEDRSSYPQRDCCCTTLRDRPFGRDFWTLETK